MTKTMLIDAANQEEVRVCVLENGKVEDFDFESSSRKPLRGNIYLARVTRVEPSLQAAFVEYGGNRHGFLAFTEIHPDYYQVPISDRRAIQEAEAEESALAAALNLTQRGDDEDDGGIEEIGQSDDDDRNAGDETENGETENGKASEQESASDDSDSDSDSDDAANGDDDVNDQAPTTDAAPAQDGGAEPGDDDDNGAGDQQRSSEDSETMSEDAAALAAPASATAVADTEPKPLNQSSRAELLERYKDACRKRARLLRNYKIQEVVKRRQILLVQVVKEERGNKGAALTTYLSLAGRYCVLMPNTARGGGISRKIPVAADRKRLRRIVDGLDLSDGTGLIIRTAGAKRTKAEIKRDYEYLVRLWENIRTLTLKSIAPSLIYEEANLIKRAIRDLYDKDIGSILVEGDAGYREAKDFMKMLMPSHAKNVQPYKEQTPLFLRYGAESQLDAMYQPTVRLKSGGYIVINQTEALIAIDVNSGKSTRERNIEQTALRTNLEAADEAARQCRMRDLAGLIVIDFIDMDEGRNNRAVERRLKDALKADRARIQIGRISTFGLLEMSRQRRRSGIIDGTTHACPTCGGAGAVRSHEMAALRILRAVEYEAISGKAGNLQVKAALDVALYVLNQKRAWLTRITNDYGVDVEIVADATKAGDQYEIDKTGVKREPVPQLAAIQADSREIGDVEAVEDETEVVAEDETETAAPEEDGVRRRKRRRRNKRRDAVGDGGATTEAGDEAEPEAARGAGADDDPAAGENDESRPKKRRRRGRRGGRRGAKRPDEAADAEAAAATEGETADTTTPAPDSAPPAREEITATNGEEETPSGDDGSPLGAPSTPPQAADTVKAGPAVSIAAPAAIETRSPVDTESAASSKSSKKGWWQKAIGG